MVREFIQRSENDLKGDPLGFWNYVNSKKNNSRIPGQMHFDKETLTTPESIVSAFAKSFRSVYVMNDDNNLSDINGGNEELVNSNSFLNISDVSEDLVISASKRLKNKLTVGPDGIPVRLVKSHIDLFARPLCII